MPTLRACRRRRRTRSGAFAITVQAQKNEGFILEIVFLFFNQPTVCINATAVVA